MSTPTSPQRIFEHPTFIAYARPRGQNAVLKVLTDLDAARATVPGFAFSITRAVPANVAKLVGSLPSRVRICMLLPELDLVPRPPAASGYSWLNGIPSMTATATQSAPWLVDVMEAQIDGGATVLATPSLLIDANRGELELRRMLEWADTARSVRRAQGFRILTGITIHRDWLSDDGKREILLNVLTDVPDDAFYLLVRWPPGRSGTQVAELDALNGLREVAEVLQGNERELVIGRAGLAGWAVVACGAAAWTSGIPSAHIYRDEMRFGRQKNQKPPPKIPYFLDGKLLAAVPAARLNAVSSVSGPVACSCPECPTLVGPPFNQQGADRHLLHTHAILANGLRGRTTALARVDWAIGAIESNSLGLPQPQINHLGVWRRMLQ